MEDRQALKLGHAYEEEMKMEAMSDLLGYASEEARKHSENLINGDFETMKQVYFLKGQIAGLATVGARPLKVIKQMKEAKEKLRKEEEKKKQDGKK